jgi:N-acetylmuramoyl-L-alanine amidase
VPETVKQQEPVKQSEPVKQPETVEQIAPEAPSTPVSLPAPEAQQTTAAQPVNEPQAPPRAEVPVFKLQILASGMRLNATDRRLKGHQEAEYYEEGGLFKYTVGASENYNEINQLRKSLSEQFPEAFVIAFKNGQKMNIQEAIREFKKKK